MYLEVYSRLCESRKINKLNYKKYSNLHRHHINPLHNGGSDEDENITYLSIREHIIAHFLLWKIYNNPNDLRAMKMLGANISASKRKIIGKFCHKNKIGFFQEKYSKEDRNNWIRKSVKTSVKNKVGIHNPEHKSKYCSMGGKIGGNTQKENNLGMFKLDEETKRKNASLGGKSHIGKVWIHNNTTKTRVPKNNVTEYIDAGWALGLRPKNHKN